MRYATKIELWPLTVRSAVASVCSSVCTVEDNAEKVVVVVVCRLVSVPAAFTVTVVCVPLLV